MPKYIIYLVLVLFFLIVLAPLLVVLGDSWQGGADIVEFLRLDARQLTLLKNSLIIGLGACLAALVVGLPYAFLVSRVNLPGRRFFLLAAVLPLFIPSYITTIGWITLFSPAGLDLPFKLYGLAGVIFVLALAYFPFVTLLAVSGFSSLDSRLEEAAQLTSPPARVIRKITLPLIAPYILSGAIFVFIFSVANYGVADLLRVNTYPVEIFVQFSAFYDSQAAVLSAYPLLVMGLGLVLAQRWFMGKKSYVTITTHQKAPGLINLGRYRMLGLGFCLLVVLFSLVIPLVMLLIGAGDLISYQTAWKTAHQQILNSLGLALAGATLMVCLSFPLGYLIQRGRRRLSALIDIISLIPFVVPAALLGIALIKLWNRPATNFIYQTFLVILFGYTARFSAFSVRVIASTLAQVNPNLEESADLVCPNPFKKLVKILLPLSRQGLLYSWIICFALCMGELATTLLVTPAGEATLPIRIYTLMHYGGYKLVSSLCVILILIITLIAALVLAFSYCLRPRGGARAY